MSNEEFQKSVLDSLKTINTKLDEHTKLLNAIEHRVNVNGADIERISNDVAHIQGDIKAIRSDLSRVEVATAYNWADIAKLKAVK